jgi:hypothetical protein
MKPIRPMNPVPSISKEKRNPPRVISLLRLIIKTMVATIGIIPHPNQENAG